jgi:hypothetical protein
MKFKETPKFFFFSSECSNEDVDLKGEIVSQAALLKSKDYFLTNGVISKDHMYKRIENGRQIIDERYVIGEPVSVFTRGQSTWIIGKLYKNNPLARIVIELLRRGSDKVKASIGGSYHQITTAPDGRKVITDILWCDVSLTTSPVNNTLQPVRGVIKKPIKLTAIKIRKENGSKRAMRS